MVVVVVVMVVSVVAGFLLTGWGRGVRSDGVV